MDSTGATVVSYTYGAWGKPLTTTGTLATTLGQDNPFRYRGYYYDAETGLYYLKSRYYDPDTCRFLNGDVLMSTGQGVNGYNMYAYCGNCPISLKDSCGMFPIRTMLSKNDEGAGEQFGTGQADPPDPLRKSGNSSIDKRIETTVKVFPQIATFFLNSDLIITEGAYDASSSYNWVIGTSDGNPIVGISQYFDEYFYSLLTIAGKDTSSVEWGSKNTSHGLSTYASTFDISFSFDTTLYTGNLYTRTSHKVRINKLAAAAAVLLSGGIVNVAIGAFDFSIPYIAKLIPLAQ